MQVKSKYKQTDIGQIPEEWSVRKLSEIAAVERGKFTARPRNDPQYYGGVVPFIQTGDVTNSNGYISTYSQTLNDLGLGVSKLFPANTLFFTIAANIGDVGIATFETAATDSLVAISSRSSIEKLWLYYELSSRKRKFESIATQNAQMNINLEKLRPYLIPVPPLSEQRAIATALSDADALINSLDRLIAKKRDIMQATMQRLLTGRTRLPGFSGKWETKLLGELCSKIIDGTHFTPSYVPDGIPFYSVENVTANDFQNTKFISKQEHEILSKRCKPERGDILLTRIGSIGDTKLIDWDVNASIYVSLALLQTNASFHSPYLYCYTKSKQFIKDIEARSLMNAAPKKINMGEIKDVPIRTPASRAEQVAIAQLLMDLDAERTILEQRRNKAFLLKQGMMQELLSGRTRLI